MATQGTAGTLGTVAPSFDLPGVDGKRHTLASVRGANGTVVMFLCNHCPYVKAVIDKIPRDMRELAALGVGSVAIMSNDAVAYPEDSFANMKAVAATHGFGFPYLYDESQDVARAYGAVCTPDLFGFDRDLKLVYRGRLDDAGRTPREGNRRDLVEAMRAVARGGAAPGGAVHVDRVLDQVEGLKVRRRLRETRAARPAPHPAARPSSRARCRAA